MKDMNLCCALAGSFIGIAALVGGCSGGSSSESGENAGRAGASGSEARSGAPNQAGSSHDGGRPGVGAGGNYGAGTAGASSDAGSLSGGSGATAGGGTAGESPSGPYQAVIGELCPIEATIGVVDLVSDPLSVQVSLYDRVDPWIAEAELTNPTCEYHHYEPGVCACEPGMVCSLQSECIPERRTVKDATLEVRADSEQREYAADSSLGGIYSPLDIGEASSSFAMTLRWGDTQITLDAMPVASGELDDVAVDTESTQYNMPGALDATWRPSRDGAFVRSRIPINHHAGGPTFTECRAPTSAGSFHADANMINPLAVQTGLEFQGMDHVFIAAAQTPQGCVEFRFGTRLGVFPD